MSADISATLLEALASGGGSSAMTQALLSQVGDDPSLGVLAKYLASRREDEGEESEERAAEAGEDVRELERARERAAETVKTLRRLRQLAEDMFAELQELRGRNDALAAAFGACHLCWGEDLQCQLCGGEGRPGSSLPDRDLFVQFVTPAARRLRRTGVADRSFQGTADTHFSSTDQEPKGEIDER